jgi:hypothetical protein
MRGVSFWGLFGLGSALLVISVLGSQVPWKDFTFEKTASLVAALLLSGALLVGKPYLRVTRWHMGSILTVVLSAELILCVYTLISLLTYRRP